MDKEMLIQKYFENALSTEETVTFEALLVSDMDFAKDVAFQKQLKNAITLEERKRLKEKLVNFESTKKSSIHWWYAAASVLVLLMVSFWFYNQNPTTEQLYASYFEPYPNIIEPIVRNGNNQITTKTKAFMAYESKDYTNAVKFFNSIIEDTSDEYALFYKAISHMNLDQYNQASQILKTTNWSENYNSKALWYLALSELKQNNTDSCKDALNTLIIAGDYNDTEAKELLKKLE